jgi:glycosyltransferase involved in cell wall biosynthesis
MPALLKKMAGALVHNEHDRRLLLNSYRPKDLRHLRIDIAPHGPYDHLPTAAPAPVEVVPVTRLLFFGLIRPYKGLEDLIVAFDGLTDEQAQQFSLTVVGETWENWTVPAQAIAANRHRDRITFVNRYVTDEEAAGFYARADAIVLPYRRGSASGPLQIAMSSGIHVLMYGVGGLVEAVAGYQGATVLPAGDVDALRAALVALPERAHERFADPHSWDANRAALDRMVDAVAAA